MIIVNKPCGILVQGDKTGDTPLLDIIKEYIKVKYSKQGNVFLGLVNRIDRPTSGIVIFAKTSKALSRMNEKLKKREIKKLYWLIISNTFESREGKLEGWFKKDSKKNKSFFNQEKQTNSKYGCLTYKKIQTLEKYCKIEVDLITGRHHQIRCNFSNIGYPILGDLKYGSKRSNKDGGIYLHSRQVTFIHPVSKKEISIQANPPMRGLWNVSPSY
ncbi:MAG: tRNA pseudouridine synthase C [Flavobacteriales bacterium]|nr:MAG: tRNA pseudouridine synthase C [Flavobacteriales bacterium]